MRTTTLLAALLAGALLVACSSDDDSSQRRTSDDDEQGDAGLTEAGVDPNGDRDDTAASCFAACSNTAFTCQAASGASATLTQAELSPDPIGCKGTMTEGEEDPVALLLDCVERKVCVGGAPGTTPTTCVSATFSATAFAYTPSGGEFGICTRNLN